MLLALVLLAKLMVFVQPNTWLTPDALLDPSVSRLTAVVLLLGRAVIPDPSVPSLLLVRPVRPGAYDGREWPTSRVCSEVSPGVPVRSEKSPVMPAWPDPSAVAPEPCPVPSVPKLKPSSALSDPLYVANVPAPVAPAGGVAPSSKFVIGLPVLSVCGTCVALSEGAVADPFTSATVGTVALPVELPLPVERMLVAPVPSVLDIAPVSSDGPETSVMTFDGSVAIVPAIVVLLT